MQGHPFKASEKVNLQTLEIDPNSFKLGILSFESDKYISVKDTSKDGTSQLTVVEADNQFKYTRIGSKAEAALMHPTQNIIALKARAEGGGEKYILQVFERTKKERLKSIEVNETIVFWKWFNNDKLGIVTGASVYLININNANEGLLKLFDRAGALAGQCQIIGLAMDPSEKWVYITALSTPDGGKTITGHTQLMLLEDTSRTQLLDAHCACFGEIYHHSGDYKSNIFSFFERKPGESSARIHFTEITPPKEGSDRFKRVADIGFSADNPNDFPIYMQVSTKHGLLYVVSKLGVYFIYEISSASIIYKSQLPSASGDGSIDPIFIGTKNRKTDGVLLISKKGRLLSIDVDESQLVNYIIAQCKHIPDTTSVALRLALHYKLPGAESMLGEQFNKLIAIGDYARAAKFAADSPGLRTKDTIDKLKNVPPGITPQPIALYFQSIIEKGKLNAVESIEIVIPVLQQGKKQLVEQWLTSDKLECTEDLGETIKKFDPQLAVQVFSKCSSPQRVVISLMEAGQFDKAIQMSNQTGAKPDFLNVLRGLIPVNPESGLNAAKQLCSKQNPQLRVHDVAEIFLTAGKFQELTAFLVETMRDNKAEDAIWQTKVLEWNITYAPQVAEAIFQMDIWSQYNKNAIARLCESKGLFQRALENYTEMKDVRNILMRPFQWNPEWLVTFISKFQPEFILQCMQDLLRLNRNNMPVIINIAVQNWQKVSIPAIIKIFEAFGFYDGLFSFLNQIVFPQKITDADVHFKYIESAARANLPTEVERIIRESKSYDPAKVKDFLMEVKLGDPKPIMFLCDLHGFVADMTKYFYKIGKVRWMEGYLYKLNPAATPQVVGTLMDVECDEQYIKQLLNLIKGNCPIEELVVEFEKRSKLRVLEPWLRDRVDEGNQTTALHNALAKIYIDTNKDPQTFLINNPHYDKKVIGKYCEEIDPHLALIAYKKAWGECDNEIIEVTNRSRLFRVQARYLVERRNMDLWTMVLTLDNPHRKEIIEQVVSSALPESKVPEEVSVTVQAFIAAGLTHDLINLLERIVLHNSEFSNNEKLQNLLIITAIKTDKTRVMDYINKLDNYNGEAIAKIALGEQYQLYEEAFTIYKKCKRFKDAVEVLINNIENIKRAAEFAEKVNIAEVWSKLAKAYLDNNLVVECIDAYLKANDPSMYQLVIAAAVREEKYEHLIKYLLMARKSVELKDPNIDNELCYCYAKCGKLNDLEVFIYGANSADLAKVGDRCFADKLYEAAKIIFTNLKNNAKLASCLVMLKQYQQAIESAKVADNVNVWKDICVACIQAKEFRLASQAGERIMHVQDLMDDIIKVYEKNGSSDEAIALLEYGMQLKTKHSGIYTDLGMLYAKYRPERLMEHCKSYFQNLNVSKLLRECEKYWLWQEAVFLHSHYEEYDNAIKTMIEHSPTAFNQEIFINLIQKVSQHDLYVRAVEFYLEEEPLKLNDLLKVLATKIELNKLVSLLKKRGYLALIVPFLRSVQNVNSQDVNEALNEIYLESDDYESLRQSVTTFENIDQLSLAQATERHELLEFRRISAYLYRKNQKFSQSITLSKQDEQFKDAVETAYESGSPELIEDLLKFFVTKKDREFFTASLYTCYEFLKPDAVLEYAWRFGLLDFAMPYFIQVMKDLTQRVETVQKKDAEREKKEIKQQQLNQPLDMASDLGFIMPQIGGMGMLMPPPGSMPGFPGMNPFGGNGPMGGGFNQMGGMGGGFNPMGGMGGGFNPMGM